MALKKEHLYPFSNVKIIPGDILYSSIGKSTYFVGHLVIIGTDLNIKESLPTSPSGHSTTVEQFWRRHQSGDLIRLYRPERGAAQAAHWAKKHVENVQIYSLFNCEISCINKNYCSKFIIQAYYYGANYLLSENYRRLILPQKLIRSKRLNEIAIFNIN